MKETVIYRASMITRTEILLLRTSEKRGLITAFLRDYMHQYIKDLYGWSDVEIVKGEDTYTLINRETKNFICCFMCSQIIHILDREEEETEETAEN